MRKTVKSIFFAFGILFFLFMLATLPNMLWIRIKANETAAEQSMQRINTAERQYASAHPGTGFSCSFDSLGWPTEEDRKNNLLTPVSPEKPSEAVRYGYVFALSGCTQGSVYRLSALPVNVGKTGRKSFCSDEHYKITVDASGDPSCGKALE